jgi:starch phosphorylase
MTNGITQRRWLLKSNPPLASLITETIGDKWITDLYALKELEKFKDDSVFLDALIDVKKTAKHKLWKHCRKTFGIELDTDTLFDVQIKRIHEYKRQLLNVLHIVYLYNRIRKGEKCIPRTFIFGGKAAPGYYMAKLIIKLINNVGYVINRNPHVYDSLKVHFLWDYGVSQAEKIIPSADISEQISMAGTEASGTSNMKFMLNGALTLGTLDGANIEIKDEAGDENVFIFGLRADEIAEKKKNYNPHDFYLKNPDIKETLDLLFSGHFDLNEPDVFEPVKSILMQHDTYMHLADFDDYIRAHKEAEKAYSDRDRWMQMVLHNISSAGKFSSDRTIKEYAENIWKIKPLDDQTRLK